MKKKEACFASYIPPSLSLFIYSSLHTEDGGGRDISSMLPPGLERKFDWRERSERMLYTHTHNYTYTTTTYYTPRGFFFFFFFFWGPVSLLFVVGQNGRSLPWLHDFSFIIINIQFVFFCRYYYYYYSRGDSVKPKKERKKSGGWVWPVSHFSPISNFPQKTIESNSSKKTNEIISAKCVVQWSCLVSLSSSPSCWLSSHIVQQVKINHHLSQSLNVQIKIVGVIWKF